jgi:hypothetical protein
MNASILRAAAVVVLVVTPGCVYKFRRGGPPDVLPERGNTNGATSAGQTDGFGLKSVYAKQPPFRLIARDGTSCTVSEKKFESTRLGASVWCTWANN